jgi:hypothetical protein
MADEVPHEVTPRIVSAVLTSVNSGQIMHGGEKSPLAKLLEKAMSEAVVQALADGVSIENTEEILRRKFVERDRVLAWYDAKMAEFAEATRNESA